MTMQTQVSEKRQAEFAEALHNATTGQAFTNYPAIFAGFVERGLPETEIKPRENVFTYNAWRALGRQVRKGEHGVRVVTWIPVRDKEDPEKIAGKRPWTTTVFHISQTDPVS